MDEYLSCSQVTVNGVPLFEQTDFLATCICVAFNGSRPEACYKAPEALLGGVSLDIRKSSIAAVWQPCRASL